jgi:adenosine deaminase
MKKGINDEKLSWYERIPKVELHLHLEGAIPLPALRELIGKYHGKKALPDIESLRSRFVFRDFSHFIQVWCWKNQFLREYDDFAFISEALGHHLALQNVRYAEISFSPRDFSDFYLEPGEIARAIRSGFSREPAVEISLIADLVRDYGAESAAITLAQIAEARDQGIIGIGIGGSEHRYPPGLFEKVYIHARNLGFHTTAHAGEAAGHESIWGAIQTLKVERIGHGTRSFEDEGLLDYLAFHKLPLEMCPLSNVCLGIVPSFSCHPIRDYFNRGIPVTVNTDDPLMFGNSLAMEYRLLVEELGFSRDDICMLIEYAIAAAWLQPEKRAALLGQFRSDMAWNDR